MKRPASDQLLRLLAPLLVGAGLGVVLQVTDPETRLHATASPGLLAGIAGILGTLVLVCVALIRRRAAVATAAAVRAAAAEAADDRLRFLMRLDHELKNPLTAIRAGLANIEQTGAMASTAADGAALASVSDQADRITQLVGDLRKLADLETQDIEYAEVDMPGMLHEVQDAIEAIPAASERVIRVSVPQAPWPLPPVAGDADLLFIALQNLITNAIKFSAPQDTVEVRASEDGSWLLLEVADTGSGIPDDEIGVPDPGWRAGVLQRAVQQAGHGSAELGYSRSCVGLLHVGAS